MKVLLNTESLHRNIFDFPKYSHQIILYYFIFTKLFYIYIYINYFNLYYISIHYCFPYILKRLRNENSAKGHFYYADTYLGQTFSLKPL